MENPLFRSRWNPVRHGYLPQEKPKPSKPKVVSIPVHFVRSDEKKTAEPTPAVRSAAAVKIQKVCRGFLVRKNVRTVRKIEAEVDEIERKIKAEEDLICREEKERLRMNEMLMALLLRLDSVRGVRDYRKKVIRRVISLQEAVDSISASRDREESSDRSRSLGLGDGAPDQTLETADQMEMLEENKSGAVVEETETLECVHQISTACDQASEMQKFIDAHREEAETGEAMEEIPETKEVKNHAVQSAMEAIITGEETLEIPESTPPATEEEAQEVKTADETLESRTRASEMKDVMEGMVAETERLRGLVAELCERSAQQCRLMGGLAERVEHLERVVQKMERKKKQKKRKPSSSLSSSDFSL